MLVSGEAKSYERCKSPKWNTYESMRIKVLGLQKQGYTFAKLEDYPLKSKKLMPT